MKNRSQHSNALSAFEIFELLNDPNLRLFDHAKARMIGNQLLLNPKDPYLLDSFARHIQQAKVRRLHTADAFYANWPPRRTFKPPFINCVEFYLPSGELFPFPISQLSHSCIICGRPGAAKTSLTRHFIKVILESGGTCIYFERKRQGEIIDARTLLDSQFNVISLRAEQIPLAPFQPLANEDVITHARIVVELIATNLSLHASQRVVLEVLEELYNKKRKRGTFPTWSEVTQELKRRRLGKSGSAEVRYAESSYFAFRQSQIGFGKCIDYACSDSFDRIVDFKGCVAISTENLADAEASLLACLLMNWSYKKRRRNPDQCERLLVYVFDDSLRLVIGKQQNEEEGVINSLSEITRMSRAFNQGSLVVSQNYSVISPSLRNNVMTTIACASSGRDAFELSRDMNLSREQSACLPALQPGQCVVHARGFYSLPLKVTFLELP